MGPVSVLSAMVRRVGRNVAYNLNCFPADKLDWKPAPEAKSALEIVNHVSYYLAGMGPALGGSGWSEPQITPARTAEEAGRLIIRSADSFADALEGLTGEDLHRQVQMPFGSFPAVQVATMGSVELAHHHGQVCYIQTLLGDTEDHFDPEVLK
jgi:hypothetical protein